MTIRQIGPRQWLLECVCRTCGEPVTRIRTTSEESPTIEPIDEMCSPCAILSTAKGATVAEKQVLLDFYFGDGALPIQ